LQKVPEGSRWSPWRDGWVLVTPEAWERLARGAKRPRVLWRKRGSTLAGVEGLRVFARPFPGCALRATRCWRRS
jgi:hypothetical protein